MQPIGRTQMFYWNGQELIALEFPPLVDTSIWHSFQWTANNHLFITIGYDEQGYMQPIGRTQMFYWNGRTVHEVPSPSEDETFMLGEFSNDGRLLLYTTNSVVAKQWYIWDGVSFAADNVPDTSTLTAINSTAESIQDIDWMPDGRLAIAIRGNAESDTLLGHPYTCSDPCPAQVVIWDKQSMVLVEENEFNGFLVDVHDSGYMTISIFNGLVISGVSIFDNNLEPIFGSGGPYSSSRWSIDGNLAYCHYDDLNVWNGQDTIRLSSRTYAKWLFADSYGMTCSTG